MLPTLMVGLAFAGAVQADLHLDTPHQLLSRGVGLDAPLGLQAGLVALREGGTNVAVMALWPPRREPDPAAYVEGVLDRLLAEIERLPDVVLVRDPEAARAAVARGQLAVVVSLEGAQGLGEVEWRAGLERLQARGLSMVGLTWSFSNRFAGSSGDGGGGLTAEGEALKAELLRRGLMIDLSHASRQTTMALCKGSPAPVFASHSDAFALQPDPRNLTDEEIRCISATGGVIGLNLHAPFLGPGAGLARAADHVEWLSRVGGPGSVGLGTDFDGMIQLPEGLPSEAALPDLLAELSRRGWSEEQLADFRGEAFLTAWARVRAAATDSGARLQPAQH